MITDGYGLIVERRSYDTWGKQRKVIWKDNDPLAVVQEAITNRGYTGHEEISEIGLIHMNGRVYDQELARFISPDPHIQSPFLTNSFNRYTYAMNNPLKYTDPTGFIWGENSGTCNVDGTTRDSNGKETGRWDNDKNGATNDNKKNSDSIQKEKISSTQELNDEQFSDLKGGRFVADKNQIPNSNVIHGKLQTIEQDTSVKQSLNTDLEQTLQGELPSTQVTDTVGAIAEALAPKPLKPVATAMHLTIANTENVSIEITLRNEVTYKLMEERAVQFEDGTTYTKGPRIDSGIRVRYSFVTDKRENKINVPFNDHQFIKKTNPSH